MNNKGFTLIELITVIAILAIIGVISTPRIMTAFKESKADQLEEVRQKVADATDVYLKTTCGKATYETLMRNDQANIYLNVIVECGLLEDKIYNPMNDEYFDIDNEYINIKIDEVGMIEYELSF